MIPPYFQSQIQVLKQLIVEKCTEQAMKGKKRLMVGVCGIPGSGKSTIAGELKKSMGQITVLPMDGFHIFRKFLDEEGMRRRGAPFTFDLNKFALKMKQIKDSFSQREVLYPDFDHSAKDPIQDAIKVPINAEIVIVEGIYIYSSELGLDNFWDIKVWVDTERKVAEKRVAIRHFDSKICPTMDAAYERSEGTDRLNADYVMENCFTNLKEETIIFIFNNT